MWPHGSRQDGEKTMVYKKLQIILCDPSKNVLQRDLIGDLALNQRLRSRVLAGVTAMVTAACGAQPQQVQAAQPENITATTSAGTTVNNQQASISQKYRNLDEYLAYLRRTQAPIDRPWYREIRSGVYELQTGNFRPLGGEGPKRTFTREELLKKFGFKQ